jgi:uncharacterized protein YcbK (DUF882 family)
MQKKINAIYIITALAVVALVIIVLKKYSNPDSREKRSSSKPNRAPFGIPGTANFSLSEFTSKDGETVPVKYYGNLSYLMQQLETIREYFGGSPVKIHSGYRSIEHNKAVGGVEGSKHTTAQAADFSVKGYTPKQVQAGIKELITLGKLYPGGLGEYSTFTHYDTGDQRNWS